MLSHQSEKAKRNDIIAMLKQLEDEHNWARVNSPTSFEDIATFETNNKFCVNVFGWCEEKNEINSNRLGLIPHIKNGNISLLVIKDEHDNGHYL